MTHHHVLAAAIYTLKEGDQPSRSGSILLFNVDANAGRHDLFHQVDTAVVFDIKWSPIGGDHSYPLHAQVDADGCLRIHSFDGKFLLWLVAIICVVFFLLLKSAQELSLAFFYLEEFGFLE